MKKPARVIIYTLFLVSLASGTAFGQLVPLEMQPKVTQSPPPPAGPGETNLPKNEISPSTSDMQRFQAAPVGAMMPIKRRSVSILTQAGGTTAVVPSGSMALGVAQRVGAHQSTSIFNAVLNEDIPKGGLLDNWSVLSSSFRMEAHGRHGGVVCQDVNAAGSEPVELRPKEGILDSKVGVDPECTKMTILPAVCPNMSSSQSLYYGNISFIPHDLYLTPYDPINYPPIDVLPKGFFPNFNHHNALRIKNVTTEFDWEDGGIMVGHNSQYGDLYEHEGGPYANLHYSIFPCNSAYDVKNAAFLKGLGMSMGYSAEETRDWPKIIQQAREHPGDIAKSASRLERCRHEANQCSPEEFKAMEAMQYLLHLGMRKMDEINEPSPPFQYHSQLPGPFWTGADEKWSSKEYENTTENTPYDKCEWLDTAHQAPQQSVAYDGFYIFDWDAVPQSPDQCLTMIIFESDGYSNIHRDTANSENYIGPTDVEEDLVAYFTFDRLAIIGRDLTLTNYSGDLTVTLTTNP